MGEIHYVLESFKANSLKVDEDSINTLTELMEESMSLGLHAQVNTYRELIAEKKYLALDFPELVHKDGLPCLLINPETKLVQTKVKGFFGNETTHKEEVKDLDAKQFYIIPAEDFKPRMPSQVMRAIASKEFSSYHVGIYTASKDLEKYYSPQRVDPVLIGFNGTLSTSGTFPFWGGSHRAYAICIWGEDMNCEEIHSSFFAPGETKEES